MITVKQNTTLVGVTELRHNIDKVLEEAQKHLVVVEKRNKPIAVFFSIEAWERIKVILDDYEDRELGLEAKKRVAESSPKDYVSLQEAKSIIWKKP